MNITAARTFLAIVDSGSFFAAAERLNVTQSTVSSRIQKLEEEIGSVLFDRSKAGARLTAAGTRFQRHAIGLVRVWEHARREVGLGESYSDHLSVGAQFSLWDGFLLEWTGWMREHAGDIALTASFGLPGELMQRIGEGSLDLAVMYRPSQRPGLEVEHLFDDEIVMVTSRPAGSTMAADSYIFVNWGPEFQADHALAFPKLGRPGVYLDLGTLGVSYLLSHAASGYFPLRSVAAYLRAGELRLVEDVPRFHYPAYAVYPQERDGQAYVTALSGLRTLARANAGRAGDTPSAPR